MYQILYSWCTIIMFYNSLPLLMSMLYRLPCWIITIWSYGKPIAPVKISSNKNSITSALDSGESLSEVMKTVVRLSCDSQTWVDNSIGGKLACFCYGHAGGEGTYQSLIAIDSILFSIWSMKYSFKRIYHCRAGFFCKNSFDADMICVLQGTGVVAY